MAEQESRYEFLGESDQDPGFERVRVFLGEKAVRAILVRRGSRFSDRPKPTSLDENH